MKPNVVIFDKIHSVIARSAEAACIDAGLKPLSAEMADLALLLSEYSGLVSALILDHPIHSEKDFDPKVPAISDINRICNAVRTDLTNFLSMCRTATANFMQHKKGSVWAICIDDVASDLLGGLTAPIASQARIGALKSLAKEYGKMGLTYNAFVCQPPKEFFGDDVWRASREALKVYALRYKAPSADEYGRFLISSLNSSRAMNGAVVHIGVGVTEMVA